MKKVKGFAIFTTILMLTIIFGACYTASADGVVSLGVFVRKEGTEDPINPAKVKVWYTRLNVPNPEEEEALYVPQLNAWLCYAPVKDGRERVTFEIRVLFKDTEQVREVDNLTTEGTPDYYREYFYFIVKGRPRNTLLFIFLELLLQKFNWQFPLLKTIFNL